MTIINIFNYFVCMQSDSISFDKNFFVVEFFPFLLSSLVAFSVFFFFLYEWDHRIKTKFTHEENVLFGFISKCIIFCHLECFFEMTFFQFCWVWSISSVNSDYLLYIDTYVMYLVDSFLCTKILLCSGISVWNHYSRTFFNLIYGNLQ